MIDEDSVKDYESAIDLALNQGGKFIFGDKIITIKCLESGHYAMPTIIEEKLQMPTVKEKTFVSDTICNEIQGIRGGD